VILDINFIAQSQCSLSGQDVEVLNEALERLQLLKKKKGKTNGQIRKEIELVFELLVRFLI
jgi:ABC-type phosphate transport system auxiliary subunit